MGLKDWERPLVETGIERANKVSTILKKKKMYPGKIISSHAFRALNTAVIFALNLDYPVNEIEVSYEIYGQKPRNILNLIQTQNNSISTLMIFGHNPTITELFNILTKENLQNLSTSAVACIQFESDTWKNFHQNKGGNLFIETGK